MLNYSLLAAETTRARQEKQELETRAAARGFFFHRKMVTWYSPQQSAQDYAAPCTLDQTICKVAFRFSYIHDFTRYFQKKEPSFKVSLEMFRKYLAKSVMYVHIKIKMQAGRKTRTVDSCCGSWIFFSQKNGDMILTPKVCPKLRARRLNHYTHFTGYYSGNI